MFEGSLNDGFYDLGLRTADIIQRALDEGKIVEERDAQASMKEVNLEDPPSAPAARNTDDDGPAGPDPSIS